MKKFTMNIMRKQDKNIYLHIGTPKTGTSALQSFLLKNSIELNKQGFDYPEHKVDVNDISSGNGQEIINILNKEGKKQALKYVDSLFSKCKNKNIIISSESLYRYPEKIHSLFPNAKIIVYFRAQLYFIESSFNQGVKRSSQKFSFSKALNRVLKTNDTLYSGELLEEWAKLYGYENIILRVYEKAQFFGGTIYADFISSIGGEFNNNFKLPEKSINVSYSRDALEYKLLLNNLLDGDDNPLQHQMIDQALQGFSQIYFKNGGKKYSLYSNEERGKTLAYYENINKIIAKKFLKQQNGKLFSEMDSQEIAKSYRGLSNANILQLTRYIITMFPEITEYITKKILEGVNSDKDNIKLAAFKLAVILTMPKIQKKL